MRSAVPNLAVRMLAWLAAAVTAMAMLLAAGPAAEDAGAASPCKRWGGVHPERLSNYQARQAVLCLVNKKRANHNLRDLRRDGDLQKAAQKHSEYMDRKNCFSHQCPGEGSVSQRLGIVGYLLDSLLRWAYGENIAYGEGRLGTPRKMVRAWMRSDGHRKNILSPHFREIGVGFVRGTPMGDRKDAGLYTTDFGLAVK